MIKHYGDHDGKTKTSSAVDAEHYPDLAKHEEHSVESAAPAFSHSEQAALAYKLWEEAGRPSDSQEHYWFEAEQKLREKNANNAQARVLAAQAGSVQR